MTKIAVIGSNSFSGQDFVDLLLEEGNYQILGISRSEEKDPEFLSYRNRSSSDFSFLKADLNHDAQLIQSALDKFHPDYIVNFAAQSEVAPSWDHPEHWFETNAVAIAKLGNYLKDVGYLKKYVHISSPEVYGTCEGIVREDAPLNPSTPYAASKAAGDLFLFTLVKNFNFPMSMVRATNVYGPGQQLFKIIPRSVISIKKGNAIQLHGGGKAVKSYIHIRDVSRGELDIMLKGEEGEIYHLSPDGGISVHDLVHKICSKMNVNFEDVTRSTEERLGQDRAYVINSDKIRNLTGWSPSITIDTGLDQVIRWVESNWDYLSAQQLEYIHKA